MPCSSTRMARCASSGLASFEVIERSGQREARERHVERDASSELGAPESTEVRTDLEHASQEARLPVRARHDGSDRPLSVGHQA